MFERVPNYPMAVTAASGADKIAVGLAVDWLIATTEDVGGQPLVYAPNRPSLREWPILANLDGWAVVATWKSFGGWSGGAVLAAWPDAEHLALVADDDRARAVCSAVVRIRGGRLGPRISSGHAATHTGGRHARAGDHL